MKVSELIRQLQKLDGDLDVYCYQEGPEATADSGPYEVVGTSLANVELSRSTDGKPVMKFGTPAPRTVVAIIGITGDF